MALITAYFGFPLAHSAALDQSGGSTPGALRLYGIPDSAYSGEVEMFRLVHEMRVRIMTAPAFAGAKVIAAILFERTMDGQAQEKPVPAFLWEGRGVIPFLKIDNTFVIEIFFWNRRSPRQPDAIRSVAHLDENGSVL